MNTTRKYVSRDLELLGFKTAKIVICQYFNLDPSNISMTISLVRKSTFLKLHFITVT